MTKDCGGMLSVREGLPVGHGIDVCNRRGGPEKGEGADGAVSFNAKQ
jgi:hypothetical protein